MYDPDSIMPEGADAQSVLAENGDAMTLVYITIAWSLGLMLTRAWGVPLWMLAMAAGLGVGCAASLRGRHRVLALALLMASCLGATRHWLAMPRIDESHLAYYNDSGWLCLEGYVSAEPIVRDTYTQLEVTAEAVVQEGLRQPVDGVLVVSVPHYPAYVYGTRLRLCGLLQTPPVFEDFSYREYLAARGVHSILRRAAIESIPGWRGHVTLRWAYAVRDRLRGALMDVLPDPDAGLLSGILLGLGHTLPDYVYDAFCATGLTHIIVISGYNISLVSQVVICSSGALLRRKLALGISLAAIVLYTMFVGPSPPVTRAALMGALFVLGQLVGRPVHLPTSLAFATLAMTAFNPLLVSSVSFQLSFAATLALTVVEPAIARRLRAWLEPMAGKMRARHWLRLIRDALLVTLVAQVMTLPIVWYHFGKVSLISPLANALVLPAQPGLMLFGVIAMVLGLVWMPIGRIAGWLAWPFTRYTLAVVHDLERVPWASAALPDMGPWGAAGAFMGLFVALTVDWRRLWDRVRDRIRDLDGIGDWVSKAFGGIAWLGVLALIACLMWVAVRHVPDGRLHVYALDVGQGDAILVRSPGGRTILVDGGPDPLTLTSRLGRILPFWDRRIDVLIATHADRDHLAGLLPVVARYDVSYVIESPMMSDSSLTREWHARVASSGAQRLSARRGLRLVLGAEDDCLVIDVLHPDEPTRGSGDDDNRNSVVATVTMGRCRVLLTGDIDEIVERQIVLADREGALRAPVLKVPHHGACGATSTALIDAVAPQIALVSVGSENEYGHPCPAVLDRLVEAECRILRTDRDGTIHLISDGNSLWVRTCAW